MYYKIVFSLPAKDSAYTRATVVRGDGSYQATLYTATQAFHKSLQPDQVQAFIDDHLGKVFMQYHAWDGEHVHSARVSKKGKLLTSRTKTKTPPADSGIQRKKNHLLPEGTPIPVLRDMGILTQDGRVVAAMQDKFKQINRFLELLADEVPPDVPLNIIDFGCGKSYLTFLAYHYFAVTRRRRVCACGLDAKADVIQKCNAAAQKYGYDALHFEQGDISGLQSPPLPDWKAENTFNIVLCLHACDTATDHALHRAVTWQADLIFAVPCCQHELNEQFKPTQLSILTEYGIIQERVCALLTDALRARLLCAVGYKAQVLEFVDLAHTPKNLLIRARRSGRLFAATQEKALDDVAQASQAFSVEPLLYRLLFEATLDN